MYVSVKKAKINQSVKIRIVDVSTLAHVWL